MADRELLITIRLAKEAAARQNRELHEEMRADIKETGKVQDKERQHNLQSLSRWAEQYKRIQADIARAGVKDRADEWAQEQKNRQTAAGNTKKTREAIRGLYAEKKRLREQDAALLNRITADQADREAKAQASRRAGVVKGLADDTADRHKADRIHHEILEGQIDREIKANKTMLAAVKGRLTAGTAERRRVRDKDIQDAEKERQREALAQSNLRKQLNEANSLGLRERQQQTLEAGRQEQKAALDLVTKVRSARQNLENILYGDLQKRMREIKSNSESEQKAALDLVTKVRAIRAKANDLEMDRQIARKRIANYQELAKRQTIIATQAADEAKEIAAKIVAYEEAGDKKAAERTRTSFAGRLAQLGKITKGAVENATRYAKDAAAELNASVEGLEGRNRRVIRRSFEERVDSAKGYAKVAVQANKDVGKATDQAGEIQKTAAKGAGEAVDGTATKVRALAQAYAGIRIAKIVGGWAADAFRGAAESAADATKHITSMVERSEALRDRLAEILAMSGKPMSVAATAAELKQFEDAGVTPEYGIQAKSEFVAQGALMIEPAKLGAGQKGTDFRMSQGQADELTRFATTQSAALGMDDPKPALKLMTIMAGAAETDPRTGKIDTKAVKDQFARNIGLFQRATGHTAQDVDQFAEAARKYAHTPEQIEKLAVRASAQIELGPNKTRVHIDALYRAIDQLTEEKQDELGIKPGMTQDEALDAVTKAIPRMALEAAGGRFKNADAQQRGEQVAFRRMFGEQRETEALFMGHLQRGVRGGVYEKARAQQKAGGLAVAERQNREYLEGEMGQRGRQRSYRARKEAEASQRDVAPQIARENYETDLVTGPEFRKRLTAGDAISDVARHKSGIAMTRTEYEAYQGFGETIRDRLEEHADDGSEKAAQFLANKADQLVLSFDSPLENTDAQNRGYNLMRELDRERAARVKAGKAPFPNVQNAAERRAMAQLQGEGQFDRTMSMRRLRDYQTQEKPLMMGGSDTKMENAGFAVKQRAARILAEQRKKHGQDDEAIMDELRPGGAAGNAAANEARLARPQPAPEAAAADNAAHPERAARDRAIMGRAPDMRARTGADVGLAEQQARKMREDAERSRARINASRRAAGIPDIPAIPNLPPAGPQAMNGGGPMGVRGAIAAAMMGQLGGRAGASHMDRHFIPTKPGSTRYRLEHMAATQAHQRRRRGQAASTPANLAAIRERRDAAALAARRPETEGERIARVARDKAWAQQMRNRLDMERHIIRANPKAPPPVPTPDIPDFRARSYTAGEQSAIFKRQHEARGDAEERRFAISNRPRASTPPPFRVDEAEAQKHALPFPDFGRVGRFFRNIHDRIAEERAQAARSRAHGATIPAAVPGRPPAAQNY